jgi:hypothetical protein
MKRSAPTNNNKGISNYHSTSSSSTLDQATKKLVLGVEKLSLSNHTSASTSLLSSSSISSKGSRRRFISTAFSYSTVSSNSNNHHHVSAGTHHPYLLDRSPSSLSMITMTDMVPMEDVVLNTPKAKKRENNNLDSGDDSSWPKHSSCGESDSEDEATRCLRTRSSSEPRTRNNTVSEDVEMNGTAPRRDRTWSLPRIIQLQQEEARLDVTNEILVASSPRRTPNVVRASSSQRLLRRRASDPTKFREQPVYDLDDVIVPSSTRHIKDTGYSAGCECDSDGEEDDVICRHCARPNAHRRTNGHRGGFF